MTELDSRLDLKRLCQSLVADLQLAVSDCPVEVPPAIDRILGLPVNSEEDLISIAKTSQGKLRACIGQIELREAARQELLAAPEEWRRRIKTGKAEYLSFSQLRLLRIQAFLVCTWSLYDCLSDVIQLLGAVYSISRNLKIHITLADFSGVSKPEKFENEKKKNISKSGKDILGARIHKTIQALYGWPVAFNYYLRNHFFHDDAVHTTSAIFPDTESFVINETRFQELVTGPCEQDTPANPGMSRFADHRAWPWSKDFVELLHLTTDESDRAVATLLEWAVQSFITHLHLLDNSKTTSV